MSRALLYLLFDLVVYALDVVYIVWAGEPGDTILSLKKKVKAITDVEPDDQRLIWIDEKMVFDESKTLKECKLQDGGMMALIYKKTADPPEWEEVDISKPDDPPPAEGE
mmetsp:Transcript_103803/g.167339  ORF Transcript_103803/g.167339 Transcript_103803/m.167339 type:complete len:109 (-) Transcript_103803:239-565(-)